MAVGRGEGGSDGRGGEAVAQEVCMYGELAWACSSKGAKKEGELQ